MTYILLPGPNIIHIAMAYSIPEYASTSSILKPIEKKFLKK
jgi:hypothetical protein